MLIVHCVDVTRQVGKKCRPRIGHEEFLGAVWVVGSPYIIVMSDAGGMGTGRSGLVVRSLLSSASPHGPVRAPCNAKLNRFTTLSIY